MEKTLISGVSYQIPIMDFECVKNFIVEDIEKSSDNDWKREALHLIESGLKVSFIFDRNEETPQGNMKIFRSYLGFNEYDEMTPFGEFEVECQEDLERNYESDPDFIFRQPDFLVDKEDIIQEFLEDLHTMVV